MSSSTIEFLTHIATLDAVALTLTRSQNFHLLFLCITMSLHLPHVVHDDIYRLLMFYRQDCTLFILMLILCQYSLPAFSLSALHLTKFY